MSLMHIGKTSPGLFSNLQLSSLGEPLPTVTSNSCSERTLSHGSMCFYMSLFAEMRFCSTRLKSVVICIDGNFLKLFSCICLMFMHGLAVAQFDDLIITRTTRCTAVKEAPECMSLPYCHKWLRFEVFHNKEKSKG